MLLNVCNSHNVCKNTGSSYVGSCTISLYEHGVFLVSFGGKANNVVAAFKCVEGMSTFYFAQSDASFAVVPFGHKSPAFVFAHQPTAFFLEKFVQCRKFFPEFI